VMAVLQTALESAKAGQVLELSLSEEDRRAYERSLS
jgi:hypothetical protein